MTKNSPIYLVDGSAYIYRAYHAITPLTNSSGLPTHAVYGFTNILLRLIREKSADHLAVAFDLKGPTFRHQLYPDYKATRPPMPEDLACQLPYVRKVVAAYNIPCLEREGFEADDLIASAARRLQAEGRQVVVVSGDKDLLQLVADGITLWDPMNDRLLDPAAVAAKYGVPAEHLLDYFALVGDSSDNVPGVVGVGPKTAAELIGKAGSLESLYGSLDELAKGKKKLAEKLRENREKAFLSRDLIRLRDDLETPPAEGYLLPEPDNAALQELFTFLGFAKLLKSQVASPPLDRSGYRLLNDPAELRRLAAELATAAELTVDTETTSLDPLSAELVGISLCASPGTAWYIPLGHRDSSGILLPDQPGLAEVLEILRPLLESPALPKIGHNLKYDYSVLKCQGVTLAGELRDTMLASYLVDPNRRSHKLDDLARELLQFKLTTFAEVTVGQGKGAENFAQVAPEAARDYSCEDVHAAALLWEHFRPRLAELGLRELFDRLEAPLIPVLAGMELAGITVERAQLLKLAEEFGRELGELELEIYRLAGQEFNIGSPRQLGEILFEKLKLPQGRKTKTGYSTDAKVLEELGRYHDLPVAVINHRNLAKLKSTYVDNLLGQIHPATHRVHTSFNQMVAATGRLSSSNPNLQNIPIRTPEGQRIRAAFVAAPGHLFLAADYSQIDLRVMAHYSGDPALVEAFQANRDIHRQTAAEIFRVGPDFITDQMRRVAKTINFSIVYGISAFGLASRLNLGQKEAKTFIDRYFEHYPGVKRFMEEIVEQARRDGYVTTLLNRRRTLPEINSSNRVAREGAERIAINTPIQGTAADIIKLATLAADRQLRASGSGARLLLQIHDELVFEVPEAEVEAVTTLVRPAMEEVMELQVPLVVNLSTGRNLAET